MTLQNIDIISRLLTGAMIGTGIGTLIKPDPFILWQFGIIAFWRIVVIQTKLDLIKMRKR